MVRLNWKHCTCSIVYMYLLTCPKGYTMFVQPLDGSSFQHIVRDLARPVVVPTCSAKTSYMYYHSRHIYTQQYLALPAHGYKGNLHSNFTVLLFCILLLQHPIFHRVSLWCMLFQLAIKVYWVCLVFIFAKVNY